MRSRLAFCTLVFFALSVPDLSAQDARVGSQPPPPAPAEKPSPSRIRVGGNVAQTSLVRMVNPVYPEIAKAAHITGTVVLHAIIDTDGTVQQIEFVSGPPLLMKAAMDAVKQWVYKPTLLNGRSVQVDTTISVVFTLGDSSPSSAGAPVSPTAPAQPLAGGVIGGIIGGSAPGTAASPAQPAKPPIDGQLKADILHMVDLLQLKDRMAQVTRNLFDSLTPMLRDSLPATQNREKILEVYKQKLSGLLATDEFVDELIATYAKYLSDDDIKGINQFYESPAGRHYLSASVQMTSDITSLGQRLAARHIPGILQELCKDFPELQGAAKVCPQGPSEKKSLLLEPALPDHLGRGAPAGQPI